MYLTGSLHWPAAMQAIKRQQQESKTGTQSSSMAQHLFRKNIREVPKLANMDALTCSGMYDSLNHFKF